MQLQYKGYGKGGWGDRLQSPMKHRDHLFTVSCQVSLIYHRNMPSVLTPLSSCFIRLTDMSIDHKVFLTRG